MSIELKNKKVLLMGLGILGGGAATAKWLLKQGAILTITDMKEREALTPSLEKLKDFGASVKYVLGRHEEKDFLENDIIVINPDVPTTNRFVEIARSAGKKIENELTLFYKFAKLKTSIGITGTRGKTTTTNWTARILQSAGSNSMVIGNDPEKPFLSEIDNCDDSTIAVIETPSFQLEIFGDSGMAPHVSLITNLYQDHLSRHKTMEDYALAKANIFKNQKEEDFLVLKRENGWTDFFLKQNPKSKIIFSEDLILAGFDRERFKETRGVHNLDNFMAAASAAKVLGVEDREILNSIDSLPQIKWREELVYEAHGLKIYNDTAATSPEAALSAIKRFSKKDDFTVFIVGGTDRELDFIEWGVFVNQNLNPENVIFLSGSATEKMKKSLNWQHYTEFNSLEECAKKALEMASGKLKASIVFSPGAKSFEKFKNEFDRGEKFNDIVEKYANK